MSKPKRNNDPIALGDIENVRMAASQQAILDAAMRMQDQDALEANALGFLCRELVQVSLPHSNPGNDLPVWTRENGNLSLTLQPKRYMKEGELQCVGYPYGVVPRLILIHLCSEVVRTGERIVPLGSSMSQFMQDIGISDVSGGRWGTISRFKDQLRRLLTANINFTYDTDEVKVDENASIAKRVVLWWDASLPEQEALFESYVKLDYDFVERISSHPVPLDKRMVAILQKSPLALDLYFWLNHRVSWLRKDQRISWRALAQQMGSEYSDVNNFKKAANKELRKIKAAWPDLKIESARGGFILKPSRPHVTSKKVFALPSVKKS